MHRGASAVSELASEYESALQELTFNSKPLINNLTIIAGENMHAAEHIVELVEKRLFDAPPEQKLPSIYLLDSIVKNIGGVYHDLFQRNIVSIFRTTYDAVDEPTRASMRRLLATWVALWPRKVQLIHERIPSAALPSSAAPASAAGAAPSAGAASGPGRGIHINPAYLAKLQGGADRRPGGGGPSSSRRSPPPPRHSISPPPSSSASSSHRRDHGARSPPRKRPRSPPRYGPSGGGGGGGSYKSARRSPPDRINEILGHTPGGRDYDRPHRGEPEGRGAYRPRPTDAGGRFGGGGRPDDPRRPGAHPHPAPPHHHAMPPVAPRSDYNPLPGMAGGGGGYGAMPPQVAAPVAMPQPTAPPPSGGHQVILAEAQVLMQQLEQRLQTQLGQPNVDHSEVMRQLGQLRALQQQATQILTQPGQPIPMAAPAQTGLAAPNLVQNLQGLGQGQQARETILSLLQGTLASVIPPATTLSPPSSQPMSLPAAGAFVAAPAPYALQAPATAPAGIPGLAPPAPAMAMPTEDLLKNLMSMGMIGGPATGMPAAAAAPGMPAPAMVGMTQQPPMPAGMMPSQPGMPPMGGMSAGYPSQGGMPGMPMGAAGGMAGRGPYPGMPGAGGFDAAPPATHRRLDLATENVQVNKLYADFELQCGTCGLRFNDKDKMAKHLDWHFAMNKKEKQKTKKAVSRLWFTTADEWATGIDVAEKPAMPFFNEAAMEESAETPVMNVIADESQTHCGICGEKFDQFWENDLEEWMYRGAVKVEGTGQLFHQKCYEQAAAMTQQAQAQQQQQEQEAAATTSASTNADSSTTTTNNGASSSHQFWVKKEPEGEEGASRQNNANDTTPTPSFSSAEGSRASA